MPSVTLTNEFDLENIHSAQSFKSFFVFVISSCPFFNMTLASFVSEEVEAMKLLQGCRNFSSRTKSNVEGSKRRRWLFSEKAVSHTHIHFCK